MTTKFEVVFEKTEAEPEQSGTTQEDVDLMALGYGALCLTSDLMQGFIKGFKFLGIVADEILTPLKVSESTQNN